jgi:predicted dinucleotide-binding enzyme
MPTSAAEFIPRAVVVGHRVRTGDLCRLSTYRPCLSTGKVVRAFNHLGAANVVSRGPPQGTPDRRALGFAGDDPKATKLVADLYNEFGFDAIDVGRLADASRLDVD